MEEDFYYVELFEIYGGLLTENQRDAFYSHFCLDLSLAEIAEDMKVGRQSVFDSVKKAKANLIKYESVLNLKSKFCEIKNIAEASADKDLAAKLISVIGE